MELAHSHARERGNRKHHNAACARYQIVWLCTGKFRNPRKTYREGAKISKILQGKNHDAIRLELPGALRVLEVSLGVLSPIPWLLDVVR